MMECQLEKLTIHYEVIGDGRPIINLHGWPADHRHCVADFEPLFATRPGWKRIYPDLPGMGRSPGAGWMTSQDHYLDAVLDFIDAVVPGERFVLTGTSYGGYLARGVVQRRAQQMDGVFLYIPAIELDNSRRTLPPHRTLVEDPALLDELDPDEAAMFQDFAVVQSRALLDSLRNNIFPAVALADHELLRKVSNRFTFDVDTLPEPFPAPTLFLMGRQDSFCGYQDAWRILEDYPRATFAVLDRAGHGLGDEQPTLFNALVSEWLDRVEEYARR